MPNTSPAKRQMLCAQESYRHYLALYLGPEGVVSSDSVFGNGQKGFVGLQIGVKETINTSLPTVKYFDFRGLELSKNDDIKSARSTIELEIAGLQAVLETVDERFSKAVELVFSASPYLIVTGVGKSGLIGAKIAASFASTGTPSFFLHPTEASHGDLGMITSGCVVLAISNSGESRELLDTLVYCSKNSIPLIGITKNPNSMLARLSEVVLRLPNIAEAEPNRLAPTTSTTNTLAIGDALTVAVMKRRNFTPEDFGRRHPGGTLGRQLQTVADWKLTQSSFEVPMVTEEAGIPDILSAITNGRKGCVAVIARSGDLIGMITDGDIRRHLAPDMFEKSATDVMTRNPLTLSLNQKISEVIEVFTERRISNAFVLEGGKPTAVIHLNDLMIDGYL